MLPWVEKYRPTSLEEMVMDENLYSKLSQIDHTNMPNVILHGPPGTGKTTTALILAKKVAGNDFVELNASDNRGITTVSELANHFCKSVGECGGRNTKVIFLDEADNITKKAQQQLINLMDNYPNVRVILTCNNVSDLIEPIQSRCSVVRYSRVSTASLCRVAKTLLGKEGVHVPDNDIHELTLRKEGDMRSLVNELEARVLLKRGTVGDWTLPSSLLSVVLPAFVEKNAHESCRRFLNLVNHGVNATDFVHGLCTSLEGGNLDTYLTEGQVLSLLERCYDCYYNVVSLVESCDQVVAFLYGLVEQPSYSLNTL